MLMKTLPVMMCLAVLLAYTPTAVGAGVLSPRLTMTIRRAAHSATLLRDGRVLIAGGFVEAGNDERALASAELFDPSTERFVLAADLNVPRSGHTAVALADGTVLIVGGWGDNDPLASAERFDPARERFVRLADLPAPRAGHTATLLQDGRVLIAGGTRARRQFEPLALIFDPRQGAFLQIGPLAEPREGHTATRLADGNVLLAGGTGPDGRVLASAEVYDPASGRFTLAGDMALSRRKHAAVALTGGRALIIGGSDARDWRGQYDSSEVYDPATRTFMPGPRLKAERFKFADAVAITADGAVVVAGGDRRIERYDARNDRFAAGPALDQGYFSATATLLSDGRVLIAGGYNRDIIASDGAWIYGSSTQRER
jgi:hypothetical protein